MASVILRITAPHEGYRRAGRAWSCGSPQEVGAEAFTSEQLASLRADFRLTIEEIAPPEEPPLQETSSPQSVSGEATALPSATTGGEKQPKKSKGK